MDVDVRAEDPTGDDEWQATSSFLTYVAPDEDGTTTQVPELVCETEAERQHREEALEEREAQLQALLERME